MSSISTSCEANGFILKALTGDYGKLMKKQLANILTVLRIICSIPLLFFPVRSAVFVIMYLFCGSTDMIDGTVARKTNSVSEFGSGLDTAADTVFFTVCFIKILPFIKIPTWLWIWIAVIAVVKISGIIWGSIRIHKKKKPLSLHTFLNKVTGLMLFLLPFTLAFIKPVYSITVVCAAATFAAIEEFYCIVTGRDSIRIFGEHK